MTLLLRFAALFLCGFVSLTTPALAQDYALPPTTVLMEIMPDDVVTFVERADACIHYAGSSRLASLRCAELGGDHAALAQKYEKDATVTKGLQFVKRTYLR